MEDFFDEFASFLSCFFAGCWWCSLSMKPVIKTTFGDSENMAHRANGIALLVFVEPGVLCGYMISLAKYAVAFFSISTSILSWAFSLCRRLVSSSSSSIRAASLESSLRFASSFHFLMEPSEHLSCSAT